MCGISGLLYLNSGEPSLENLSRMISQVQHRGPDSLGFWADGPVS